MLTCTGYPDHFFPFRKISLVWRTNFWAQQRKRNKGKPQESWHFLATSSRQAWSSPLTASKWKPLVSHLRNTAWRKWNAALHVLHLLSMSAYHAVNSSSCTCMGMSQTHSWPVLSYLAKWKKTPTIKAQSRAPVTSQRTTNRLFTTAGHIQPRDRHPVQGSAQLHCWGWGGSENCEVLNIISKFIHCPQNPNQNQTKKHPTIKSVCSEACP